MRCVIGNLFDFRGDGNILVIPTNGKYKYGSQVAIMGAGVAKKAAKVWPDLPQMLGWELARHGNVVHRFAIKGVLSEELVWTFPTKDNWAEDSKLSLIEKSAEALVRHLDEMPEAHMVYLPRVGCGLGNLRWEDVEKVLRRHLDSRFVVVHKNSDE